jgi:hypothetical protein
VPDRSSATAVPAVPAATGLWRQHSQKTLFGCVRALFVFEYSSGSWLKLICCCGPVVKNLWQACCSCVSSATSWQHVTVHIYAKLSTMHEASCAPSKHVVISSSSACQSLQQACTQRSKPAVCSPATRRSALLLAVLIHAGSGLLESTKHSVQLQRRQLPCGVCICPTVCSLAVGYVIVLLLCSQGCQPQPAQPWLPLVLH